MLKSHAQFALMFSLEELFCLVDDFCKTFEPHKSCLFDRVQREKVGLSRIKSSCQNTVA